MTEETDKACSRADRGKRLENGSHCKPFSALKPPPLPSPPSPPFFFPTLPQDKWLQGNDRVPGPQITCGRSARPMLPLSSLPPPIVNLAPPRPSPPLVMCTRAAASGVIRQGQIAGHRHGRV
ncbi:hypothetical protein WMY93_027326 [Mugilogobius chulae]|uniref:Uncharacterized protein n=1 Tax=Mugilogobius chulae TaxID=88201 RepID=A0AAW0MX80_9GOBI